MNRQKSLIFPLLFLVFWLSTAISACVTPAQAASSPTASPTATPTEVTVTSTSTSTPAPKATPLPTPTPLPHPVCTIEWAWRENGLIITRVDFTRADGLAPGDLIPSINGRNSEEVIAEIETGLGAIGDPDLRRTIALETILFSNESLTLQVRHGPQPAYYYVLVPDCSL